MKCLLKNKKIVLKKLSKIEKITKGKSNFSIEKASELRHIAVIICLRLSLASTPERIMKYNLACDYIINAHKYYPNDISYDFLFNFIDN